MATIAKDIRLSVTASVKAYQEELSKLEGITQKEAAKASLKLGQELAKAEREAAAAANRTAGRVADDVLSQGAQKALKEIQQFERVGRVAGGTIGELSGIMADLGDVFEAGVSPITAASLGLGAATLAVGGLAYGAVSAAQAAASLVRSVDEAGTASGQAAEDIAAAAAALDSMDGQVAQVSASLAGQLAPAVERGAEFLTGLIARSDDMAAKAYELGDAFSGLGGRMADILLPGASVIRQFNQLAELTGANAAAVNALEKVADIGAAIGDQDARRAELSKDIARHLEREKAALDDNAEAARESARASAQAAAEAKRRREEAAAAAERDAEQSIALAERAAAATLAAVERTASIEKAARDSALSTEAKLRDAYFQKIDVLTELLGKTQDFVAYEEAANALREQLDRDLTALHLDEVQKRTEADAGYYEEQAAMREAAREAAIRDAAILRQSEESAALSSIGTIQAIAQAAQAGANTRTESGKRAARNAYAVSRLAAATEIGINTAIGVSQALELPPPAVPFGVAAALATGAAAGARLAAVPAPKFHSGGEVGSDEVRIVAQRGEVVVPRERVQQMGGASAVDRQLRSGSAAPTMVQVRIEGQTVDLIAEAVERRMAKPSYGRG